MTYEEQKKSILTNKGIEQKALKHREAALENTYQNTLRTPLTPPPNPLQLIHELGNLFKTIKLTHTQSIIERWEARMPIINQLIQRIASAHTPPRGHPYSQIPHSRCPRRHK